MSPAKPLKFVIQGTRFYFTEQAIQFKPVNAKSGCLCLLMSVVQATEVCCKFRV